MLSFLSPFSQGSPNRFLSESSFVLSGDDEPIRYDAPPLKDPVARLQQRMEQGQARLEYTAPGGYLLSVLKQLHVQPSSQTLVFSKTSFQLKHISPANPRALYFNDDVYVGWVRAEMSVFRPWHRIEALCSIRWTSEKPINPALCGAMSVCNATGLQEPGCPRSSGWSVYPDAEGLPLLQAGSFQTDHASPLRERWGGWYVTGTHGALRHMGNNWSETLGIRINLT